MSGFEQAKLALVHFTGLERDALHIYVSLIVFFGSCLLLRWKAWQIRPLLLVLLAALIGEFLDLYNQSTLGQPLLWGESAKDMVNTCMAPAILMLMARLSGVFRKTGASEALDGEAASPGDAPQA
ncbi:hypothetical protein H0274_05200 [Altererythrobacter sp. CC-YST694]|uniref:hypothetical protein n=1 Tax=Altererythrobacter sp. CC-YST694 TaxID=2755038 RepID=UPI001D01664B|nr:hypothetical protein [Altererythrobacter sp. CC-YST694]MCB5424647.1 hypothetical protein [Altererythrobacter sp. CC-YST694]